MKCLSYLHREQSKHHLVPASKTWELQHDPDCLTADSRHNLLHTLLAASSCRLMQGVPASVVSTVHTEASPDQPPHTPPAAGASCSSNTGHCVPVALCEVHVLLWKQVRAIILFYSCHYLFIVKPTDCLYFTVKCFCLSLCSVRKFIQHYTPFIWKTEHKNKVFIYQNSSTAWTDISRVAA